MRVSVPGFLVDEVRGGRLSGWTTGSVMMIDFPGFTPLTEAFIDRGTSGAEELSGLLNSLLRPAVDAIVSSGGYVGGFAGDSVTGVFPGMSPDLVREIAARISRELGSIHASGPGSRAKTGISGGRVCWNVIAGGRRLFHYISGAAVAAAARAQEECPPGGISVVESGDESGDIPPGAGRPFPCCTEDFFVPERVATLYSSGEFRFVTSVFVSCRAGNPGSLDRSFIGLVLDLAERYDGYLSGVDTKPSGSNALVLFGAPVSHEDDPARADHFLKDLFPASCTEVRAGVECGPVFAGLLGSARHSTYTSIGASVNLASRLMYLSEWGCVLSGPGFSAVSRLQQAGRRSMTVKGFRGEVPASLLSPRTMSEGGRSFSGTFLGRSSDMAVLEDALALSGTGSSRVVFVTGEAGTGKSRLLYEFETPRRDVRFFHLQPDGIQRRSFNPFSRILKLLVPPGEQADSEQNRAAFESAVGSLAGNRTRISTSEEDAATFLRRAVPALGSLIGLEWPESIFEKLDPRIRFDNILTALRGYFDILVGDDPAVIVIEDAHLLDPDSQRALGLIGGDLADRRVLWIIASRPVEEDAPPILPASAGGVVRVNLAGLDGATTAGLVEAELGGMPSDALASFIHERTGGNPFFVEQYCRFLGERGLVRQGPGGFDLTAVVEDLPSGLSSILIARIDSLAADVRAAVHAASVLGREFETAVLSRMLKGGEIDSSLERGVEEQIWRTLNDLAYIFRHALLRDAAYSMQLNSRLKELHSLAASSIESVHSDDPAYYDDLAFHFERAGMLHEAVRFLGLAAKQAARSFLNDQAVDLYSRQIALLPDGAGRAGAIFQLAEVEWNSGSWEDSLVHFREAACIYDRLGLRAREASCLQRAGRILLDTGEEADGLESLRTAETLLDMEEDYSVRSQILVVRAGFLLQSSVREGIESALEKGLECAVLAGDEEQCLRVRGSMGNFFLEVGDFARAISHYEDVMEGADRLGNLPLKALSLGNLALACKYLGDDERAVDLFGRQLEMARETGNRYLTVLALGNLGSSTSRGWRWREAPGFLRRAVALAGDLHAVQHEAIARINLSEHCVRAGIAGEALENSTEAVLLCREKGLDYYLGSYLLIHARALLLSGRPGDALEAVDEAMSVPMMEDYVQQARNSRAVARALLGEREESVLLLDETVASGDLEFAAEAAWYRWRLTASDPDRETALELNRRWLGEGKHPWVVAARLRHLGEDVSTLPPFPDDSADLLAGCARGEPQSSI